MTSNPGHGTHICKVSNKAKNKTTHFNESLMKKYNYLILVCKFSLLLLSGQLLAQKELINMNVIRHWSEKEQLGNYGISDNGEFIWYNIGDTTYVVKRNGKLITKIIDGLSYFPFGKSLLYIHDASIMQLNTQTAVVKKYRLGKVMKWEQLPSGYQFILQTSDSTIVLLNIRTGKSNKIQSGAIDYKLNPQKSAMVIKETGGLAIVSIAKGLATKIMQDMEVDFYTISFDPLGRKLLFKAKKDGKALEPVWYYYDPVLGDGTATLLFQGTDGLPEGYNMGGAIPSFNADGTRLIIQLNRLAKKAEKKPYKEFWHYQGRRDFARSATPAGSVIILAFLEKSKPVFKVLAEGRVEILGTGTRHKYLLVKKRFISDDELYSNNDLRPEFILANLETGDTKDIIEKDIAPVAPRTAYISPHEKYITWFDDTQLEYLCYEIATGETRNVTKTIEVPADIRGLFEGSVAHKIRSLEEWIGNDEAIVFSDTYDMWQVDPKGIRLPLALTDGYGRIHAVEFRSTNLNVPQFDGYRPLKPGQDILLVAMNKNTKDNGFYKITLGKVNNLDGSHLHPCLFFWNMLDQPAPIIRAQNSETYLVTQQTATEAPNLCITKNLKSFVKLTNVEPQKKYNWVTSELVTYPLRSGKTGQAILFKPENFDPSIKYPVIFNYYQLRSDELHKFRNPHIFENNIDVPTYVSNGYLVCMPDINNNEPGKISISTVDAVESVVDYLSRYSWFDTSKMGLQGQSFGGYETNILVTNSNRFAAASAMAGISDAVSGYFGNAFGERSATWCYEEGQFNLHTTPWDSLQTYLDNSPVLKANRITTPLLLLNNRNDPAVPFNQGYEMFYALRRLKKPVWLYVYEGGHTSPGGEESNLDFTMRLQEFFDHYLKGKPAPDWLKPIPGKDVD
jgi:dienelactone hydrolase